MKPNDVPVAALAELAADRRGRLIAAWGGVLGALAAATRCPVLLAHGACGARIGYPSSPGD